MDRFSYSSVSNRNGNTRWIVKTSHPKIDYLNGWISRTGSITNRFSNAGRFSSETEARLATSKIPLSGLVYEVNTEDYFLLQ